MRKSYVLILFCLLPGCDSSHGDATPIELLYQQYLAGDAEKYKEQRLSVSGRVYDISYCWFTPADYITVTLIGDSKQHAVAFHFAPEKVYQTKHLSKDRNAVISGIYRGEMLKGIPYLNDCSVE